MIPTSLQQAACIPAEQVINRLLATDPASRYLLEAWQGHLIQLSVQGLPSLRIRITGHELSLSAGIDSGLDDDIDLHVSGTLTQYLAVARSHDPVSAMRQQGLRIDGNDQLAIALADLVHHLDIDWEALISPVTGGLIAHQIGHGLRSLMGWKQQSQATFGMALRDFVYDETAALATRDEFEQLAAATDQLQLDCDRLGARLDQLQQASEQEK